MRSQVSAPPGYLNEGTVYNLECIRRSDGVEISDRDEEIMNAIRPIAPEDFPLEAVSRFTGLDEVDGHQFAARYPSSQSTSCHFLLNILRSSLPFPK